MAVLSLAPPVARGGIKIRQAAAFRLVQEVIVALEEGGDHGLHIGFAVDGHIQETAGGQEAAHLVQGLVHGGLVQTGHRGLEQIAGDFEAEAEANQDFAQESQAEGAADEGADAAGKLQMNVILVGIVAVKGIQVGEMIAEFGTDIDVIPGENGIAVAPGHGIGSGHYSLGH